MENAYGSIQSLGYMVKITLSRGYPAELVEYYDLALKSCIIEFWDFSERYPPSLRILESNGNSIASNLEALALARDRSNSDALLMALGLSLGYEGGLSSLSIRNLVLLL